MGFEAASTIAAVASVVVVGSEVEEVAEVSVSRMEHLTGPHLDRAAVDLEVAAEAVGREGTMTVLGMPTTNPYRHVEAVAIETAIATMAALARNVATMATRTMTHAKDGATRICSVKLATHTTTRAGDVATSPVCRWRHG